MSLSSQLYVYDIKSNGGQLNPASSGIKGARPFEHVIEFLTSRLPQSLPLLRILQMGPRDEGAFLITTLLPHLTMREPVEEDPEAINPASVWTMAYVNRVNHPGTEMWIFSSLEMWPLLDGYEKAPQKVYVNPWQLFLPFSTEVCQHAKQQLLAICSYIPISSRKSEPSSLKRGELVRFGPYLCVGNVHTRVASLLAQTPVIAKNSPAYGKYLFRTGSDNMAKELNSSTLSATLPPGFKFDTIHRSDYAKVMQENRTIRGASTLDRIRGVGIRRVGSSSTDEPSRLVAFAFAGEDGSIRALHVDEEFRRMGLAKAVVQRIISLGLCDPPRQGPFAASEDIQQEYEGSSPMGFTGVMERNEGSIKTFKAIGAYWAWDVFWLWIDLDEARKSHQCLLDGGNLPSGCSPQ
ncbi:hypothetical protein FSARC_2980 [Fusarium sarcochroum]|uniref:GCN5-related N-acetyltransferase Rv2170-like domain-containing protein n=1 Tax=Fusarium sarcochroum TaxID=1208366 RepID=A0A8H4U4S0_9HYPO|nr:hypothetical protein FSARC_2980 [Fusarium sarcochroum]